MTACHADYHGHEWHRIQLRGRGGAGIEAYSQMQMGGSFANNAAPATFRARAQGGWLRKRSSSVMFLLQHKILRSGGQPLLSCELYQET